MSVRRGQAIWSAGAVYAVSAAVCCALAARSQAHFVDLHVYRMGGAAVLHGDRLYQLRFVWLPFTYPPFAAVAFAALAVVPWKVAVTLLTGASVVALPAALYLVLRLSGPVREQARERAWTLALAAAAAAIWLEPARATLGYGQVDILLTAAVLYDLSLPDTARRKGMMIGLVAGLKLTPAIFAVYLLVTGRRRAAATAAAAFAGTVAAGFSVLPASSAWFWRAGSPARDMSARSRIRRIKACTVPWRGRCTRHTSCQCGCHWRPRWRWRGWRWRPPPPAAATRRSASACAR